MSVTVSVGVRRWLLVAALQLMIGGGSGGPPRQAAGGAGGAGGARGAGPKFAGGQRAVAVAARGDNVTLACHVDHLQDKVVSWVRSRDLQILAHGDVVFTADRRVSAGRGPAPGPGAAPGSGPGPAPAHTLRLAGVRTADAGRYECQLNTEPKMSLFFHLYVIDREGPAGEVRVERSGPPGAALRLRCRARYLPAPAPAAPAAPAAALPPLHLRWLRDGRPLETEEAVSVERWVSRGAAVSELAAGAGAAGGRYTCEAPVLGASDYVDVEPPDPEMEAMQRDEAAAGAGAARGAASVPLALLAAAAAWERARCT